MSVTDQNAPYSLYFWLEEFQDSDDWHAVMRTAKELLHLLPENPEGLRFLAEAYFRLGKETEAYQVALRLVEANPLSIDGYWILSDLAAQAGDPERCADYIERAARLIPDCDTIWVEVAKANFNLRRLARCLIAADHGLRVNPHNIHLWIFKVFALAALRKPHPARLAAGRLTALGVDADTLRDAAKELGINGKALAKLSLIANGAELSLTLPASRGTRATDTAINRGLSTLVEITGQAKPLSPKEFALQLEATRAKAEQEEDEDDTPDAHETFGDPSQQDGPDQESDPASAWMVYYVYAGYRTHGPYTLAGLCELLRDGTYDRENIFVRRESDHDWAKVADIPEIPA